MEESIEDVQKLIYGPKKGPPLLPHGDDSKAIRPRNRKKRAKERGYTLPALPSYKLPTFPASDLPAGFPAELSFRALAAYSLLRTLSIPLRLSPFTPIAFLRALYLPLPNRLAGRIHVALLRLLLRNLHMGYHWGENSKSSNFVSKKRKVDGLRWPLRAGDNLQYLDTFSWPVFFDDYCHLTADMLYSAMHDETLHVDMRTLSLGHMQEFPNDTTIRANSSYHHCSKKPRLSVVYLHDEESDTDDKEEWAAEEVVNEEAGDSDDNSYDGKKNRRKSTGSKKRGRPRKSKIHPKPTAAASFSSTASAGPPYRTPIAYGQFPASRGFPAGQNGAYAGNPLNMAAFMERFAGTPSSPMMAPNGMSSSGNMMAQQSSVLSSFPLASTAPNVFINGAIGGVSTQSTGGASIYKNGATIALNGVTTQVATSVPTPPKINKISPPTGSASKKTKSLVEDLTIELPSPSKKSTPRPVSVEPVIKSSHLTGTESAVAAVKPAECLCNPQPSDATAKQSGVSVASPFSAPHSVNSTVRPSLNVAYLSAEGIKERDQTLTTLDVPQMAQVKSSVVEPKNTATAPVARDQKPMTAEERTTAILEAFMQGKDTLALIKNEDEETLEKSEEDDTMCPDKEENGDEYSQWPQFRPLKTMRTGTPYHHLPVEQKLDVLEFLLDELLSLDCIANEMTARDDKTSGFPVPFAKLPSAEELENMYNEDYCGICRREGELLCCDGCICSYHRGCVGLPKSGGLPEGKWFCPECIAVDPAKFGPLHAGRKSCLEWCDSRSLQRGSCYDKLSHDGSVDAQTIIELEREAPVDNPLGPQFLYVHGFVFVRDSSSGFVKALPPLSSDQINRHLSLLGQAVSSEWPIAQIPMKESPLRVTHLPSTEGGRYVGRHEHYNPCVYDNRYQMAPLLPGVGRIKDSHTFDYETRCSVAAAYRACEAIRPDLSVDEKLCGILRSSHKFFSPYEMIQGFMLEIEHKLVKASLLDWRWGAVKSKPHSLLWRNRTRTCRSLKRLAGLLVSLVDSIHERAFIDSWHACTRSKAAQHQSSDESGEIFPFSQSQDPSLLSQAIQWKTCPVSAMTNLLARDCISLHEWIRENRPDLAPAVQRHKRKRLKDLQTQVEPGVASACAIAVSEATVHHGKHSEDGKEPANNENEDRPAKKLRSARHSLISHSDGQLGEASAESALELLRQQKMSEVVECFSGPLVSEEAWPVAGARLFPPRGRLPASVVRYLGRNAGSAVAPFVAYSDLFEVGQVAFSHEWRKKVMKCKSYEELLMLIRVLEGHLDMAIVRKCTTMSNKINSGKLQPQSSVVCSHRNLGNGHARYLVVKAKHGTCNWVSAQSIDLQALLSDQQKRSNRVQPSTKKPSFFGKTNATGNASFGSQRDAGPKHSSLGTGQNATAKILSETTRKKTHSTATPANRPSAASFAGQTGGATAGVVSQTSATNQSNPVVTNPLSGVSPAQIQMLKSLFQQQTREAFQSSGTGTGTFHNSSSQGQENASRIPTPSQAKDTQPLFAPVLPHSVQQFGQRCAPQSSSPAAEFQGNQHSATQHATQQMPSSTQNQLPPPTPAPAQFSASRIQAGAYQQGNARTPVADTAPKPSAPIQLNQVPAPSSSSYPAQMPYQNVHSAPGPVAFQPPLQQAQQTPAPALLQPPPQFPTPSYQGSHTAPASTPFFQSSSPFQISQQTQFSGYFNQCGQTGQGHLNTYGSNDLNRHFVHGNSQQQAFQGSTRNNSQSNSQPLAQMPFPVANNTYQMPNAPGQTPQYQQQPQQPFSQNTTQTPGMTYGTPGPVPPPSSPHHHHEQPQQPYGQNNYSQPHQQQPHQPPPQRQSQQPLAQQFYAQNYYSQQPVTQQQQQLVTQQPCVQSNYSQMPQLQPHQSEPHQPQQQSYNQSNYAQPPGPSGCDPSMQQPTPGSILQQLQSFVQGMAHAPTAGTPPGFQQGYGNQNTPADLPQQNQHQQQRYSS